MIPASYLFRNRYDQHFGGPDGDDALLARRRDARPALSAILADFLLTGPLRGDRTDRPRRRGR